MVPDSTIEKTWKFLFEKHQLSAALEKNGRATISAEDIKNCPGRPEPRLVTKFDFRNRRPQSLNKVTILPTANGVYELLSGDGYVDIPPARDIQRFSTEVQLETLPIHEGLRSESQAIDCAFLS